MIYFGFYDGVVMVPHVIDLEKIDWHIQNIIQDDNGVMVLHVADYIK